MLVNSGMSWSDWKWCKTAVWPWLCSAVTFVRRSRKWLMFCATPLPAVIGIVLPGNRLRPFVDCFGSVVNPRWPCLLLFISWYLFTWGFKSRSLRLCQIIVMLIILKSLSTYTLSGRKAVLNLSAPDLSANIFPSSKHYLSEVMATASLNSSFVSSV